MNIRTPTQEEIDACKKNLAHPEYFDDDAYEN